jgi:hypothetical protein
MNRKLLIAALLPWMLSVPVTARFCGIAGTSP